MTRNVDVAVIGGGIVGMAAAVEILRRYPDWSVLVLEKEHDLAKHQTGHNSGVIHSGLYYRPGSVKALTCVRGRRLLLQFCREEQIPFDLCGKVVVATLDAEIPRLEELYRRGKANGVQCCRISLEELREYEPHCAGTAALHVADTGIVDYRQVCTHLRRRLETSGGAVEFGAPATIAWRSEQGIVLRAGNREIHAQWLVNCAGLHSDRVARSAGDPIALRVVPFRGEYYDLKPESNGLVRGLIYPVPDPTFPFLGVHFTRRISGEIEAGPNAVLALKREGYRKTDWNWTDIREVAGYGGFWRMASKYWKTGFGEYYRSLRKAAFVQALQRLVPELQSSDLMPGGSGVRAQALDANGRLLDDFHFATGPRTVHVLNVPSPAATASMAIAEVIADRLAELSGSTPAHSVQSATR